MERLNIEYLPLDELTPYENNARKHEKADLSTIEKSIENFGMCDPIGVWGENNIIVEGHGRLMALRELGYTEAPVIRLDHLTDEQRKAYALAHNKTAEMSEWDFEKLDEEIASLSDIDMQQFGFETNADIDWAGVDDLENDNYDKPEKDMLECPHCHHIDIKNNFKKVE